MVDPTLLQVFDVLQNLGVQFTPSQAVFDPAQPDFITLQVHVPACLVNIVALVESGRLRLRDRVVVQPAPGLQRHQLQA